LRDLNSAIFFIFVVPDAQKELVNIGPFAVTDMNLGHTFDNSGEVYLQRAISMVNPCYRFAIDGGGKLIWPGLANITNYMHFCFLFNF
jgi:hypothetical protein